MSNSHSMLPKDLKPFREFIKKDGWELVPFKHPFEVLRAEKDGVIMSIYKRLKNPYLTVTQASHEYWDKYKKQTNWKPTPYNELCTDLLYDGGE